MVVGKYIMQKPVEVEALMVESPLASSYFMVKSFLEGIEDVQDISTNLFGSCQDDGILVRSEDECITIKLLGGNVLKVKPYDYIIKEPSDYDSSCKLSVMNCRDFDKKFIPANSPTEPLEEDEEEVEAGNEQKQGYCGVTW